MSWFQAFASKLNMYRYTAAAKVGFAHAAGGFGGGGGATAGGGGRGGVGGGGGGGGGVQPGGAPLHADASSFLRLDVRARAGAALRASLDPLNPEDATLLETLATRDALRSTGGGGFRLNAIDETMAGLCLALHDARWSALYREPMTCDFVSSSSNRWCCLWCRPSPTLGYTTGATKRQQLLKLRAEQGVTIPDGGGVPLSEQDIPDHLLDRSAEEEQEVGAVQAEFS
jgi:hypothetical protein